MINYVLKLTVLIVLMLVGMPSKGSGAVCTSVKSGNFTDPNTWSCGHIPVGGDQITISAGTTVTIDANITLLGSAVTMEVYGNLYFIKKLYLPAGSCMNIETEGNLFGDGTGSSSDLLFINNINLWAGECNGNGGHDYMYCGSINGYKSICDPIITPITLLYFKAKQVGDHILFSWSTTIEFNFAYFTLQESKDLLTFKNVTHVLGGTYHYYYTAPYEGNSYYRLAATDNNGTTKYFKIIYLSTDDDKKITYSYDQGSRKLIVDNVLNCELYNVIGQVVLKVDHVSNEIDLSLVAKGAYIMVLSNGTETLKEKITIY